ncbi:hypothetical protein GCM10028807_17780 [Spirosoma daeguense]
MSEAMVPHQMAAPKVPAQEDSESGVTDELPPAPPPPPQRATPATVTRKIVRNAQVRMRVSDFKSSGLVIQKAVQQTGGQISSSNELKTNSTIENALVIRVPATRFDSLLASLLKESIFTDTKSITSDDVTRRYVDTEARIRSKKATEETYLKLLKQARSVEDVLKVEEQLAEIREEREVQEAELRQLNDEITLSTINLTYYQQTEVALNPEEPFYAQIWHNLTDGFRLMGDVLVGAFYFLPIGLVIAAVVWLVQRWRRKRRNVAK